MSSLIKRYHKLRYNVFGRNKRETPIYLFSHHKTGTTLLRKVFSDICSHERWKFKTVGSQLDQVPDADVILFSHTNIVNPLKIEHPYLGVHMIRDPREVIISGCFYHKRTNELWCVSKDYENLKTRGGPIPQHKRHCPQAWKQEYLEVLGGKSYQECINSLSMDDAIEFEMRNYSCWTITDMLKWDYRNPSMLEVRMEDASEDYSLLFKKIFEYLKLDASQDGVSQKLANRHDLGRLKEEQVNKIDHVRTKDGCTWPKYFSPHHHSVFNELFGEDCCSRLGYE